MKTRPAFDAPSPISSHRNPMLSSAPLLKRMSFGILTGVSLVLSTGGCSSLSWRKPASEDGAGSVKPAVIRSDYAPGEITRLCDSAIARAQKSYDEIGKLPPTRRDIDRTLLAYENSGADLSDATTPLIFMKSVSPDAKLSKEGAACEEKVSQFSVAISARKDLYRVIKDQVPRNDAERRLLTETVKWMEMAGLKLPDDQLVQVKDLRGKLATLQNQFETNLDNDTSTVSFTPAEMDGAPASFLARLKKDAQGHFIVTTKEPDYVEFMQNVKSEEARRRMAIAFDSRAADKNISILEQAIRIRAQIARMMGFSSWADYQLQDRMAKNSKTVWKFLNDLKDKLKDKNRADLAKLLAFKKTLDPQATDVKAWDVPYLAYQLRKRNYSLDTETIRQYFPANHVVQAMFDIYSKLLGVKFKLIEDAPVWAKGVHEYEIDDARSGDALAYFYTDFYPRPLKYGHAASFPLIAGRLKGNQYQRPVAAIVANLSPPTDGKPSLLTHDDVLTLFHEFGHVMHDTLTRAPYASLSGTSVAMDFVEAPSQMLENWVWDPGILHQVSSFYKDPSKKLPDDLLKKMIAARDFNKGYYYTRQLVFAILDMTYHTSNGPVDVSKVYHRLSREIQGIDPVPGDKFPATFGHLMGGYDAGYYGYLWSEVYAQDMFTRFQKAGLENSKLGLLYRKTVLEKGNMEPAMDLLREFLGREPNSDAFFKKLGIAPSPAARTVSAKLTRKDRFR